jgi:hypothetical protein
MKKNSSTKSRATVPLRHLRQYRENCTSEEADENTMFEDCTMRMDMYMIMIVM